tara:strand:+ start:234 stop:398 length:165 start_codon:yes stop_codon:yes gene_type:complete
MRKGKIKQKVTEDYIISLFEKAKRLKSKEKKLELFKLIRKLKDNIGSYIIKPID